MIFFLAWLVLIDATEEASFFCMMKGHTYSRIDQTFRALIGQLLSVPVWTVTSLVRYIGRYLGAYNCKCQELDCLWDWKSFFAPHVHERFGGFATSQFGSGMHEFVLRKNQHGEVRFWARKHAASSTWLPDDGGYPVFKSIPTGSPQLAKAKLDEEWNRTMVESTVRHWYKYMTLRPSEKTQVTSDWEERFAALPTGGDTNLLPRSKRLVWRALPRFNPIRGAVSSADHKPSDEMENPPVNPITGLGRSTTQVAHELTEYRERIRREAGGEPAVFQTDFLFVRVPSGELSLHRVVNNACLYSASATNITFTTTEYAHVPQPNVPGFWGHFHPKLNPRYDPCDRKSGTKFVRHQEIARAHVVVYDVQVFSKPSPVQEERGKVIYVDAGSLRALSVASADHPVPCTLPETHSSNVRGPQVKRKQKSRATDGAREEEADVEEAEGDASEEFELETVRSTSRVDKEMEIQGCTPAECAYVCTECDWEGCTVVADHGAMCDVRLHNIGADEDPICRSVANRFLRMPAAGMHKRRLLALADERQAKP